MKWFLIDMPQTSLTDGDYHRLCRQFQKAFIDAGAPAELALFAQRTSESRPTASSRRLFLSPQSSHYVPDLIRDYKGRLCVGPEASSVTLIYGVPGARSLLNNVRSGRDNPGLRSETPIYPLTHTQEAASAG